MKIWTHLAYVFHEESSGALPEERKNGDHKIIDQIESHQKPGFAFIFVMIQIREVVVQNRVGLVDELRYRRVRIRCTVHFRATSTAKIFDWPFRGTGLDFYESARIQNQKK